MVAQLVKNLPEMQETLVQFLDWEVPWRRDKLHIPVFLDFPGGSDSKASACNEGDLGLIPGLGISPGEGKGNPLQYSYLENSTDRGAWLGYSPWNSRSVGHASVTSPPPLQSGQVI